MLLADMKARDTEKQVTYLYKRITNQGFKVDGHAQELVWLLDGSLSIDEIIDKMAKITELDRDSLTKEINHFIKELEDNNLLDWVE